MLSIPITAAWQAALGGLAWALGIAVATWAVSWVRRDASLVDRLWAIMVSGAGVVYAALLPGAAAREPSLVLLGIALAWAIRLSTFITVRNWGHGEDHRYRAIRERNQPHFERKSLYLVFGLQAVLAWVVSAPLFAAFASPDPRGWVAALPGLLLAAGGLVFEAVADAQMSRFKNQPDHRGRVMDRGLWRYTRHPNYFGEACVWWGLWLGAMGTAGSAAAWSVVSPLLMTFLLLRVSGVALLEKSMPERRPAYREYQQRTSAFIPWPPRTEKRP
ncbi:DUF1295 domain-containing protein [Acidovorax sp. GBBC 3334]|uniref:DUF1295 domain-containing protein n=1 Tax=Acidovorax sp. GBBC 3334 TaxID=2940496 RepID=UPI00230338BD|nr:DUF1295 domain-containing protein [Acidovorax sp. GBBC 3334]MDA8457129.1 DUF1295 domain-containing protein [Acidovorax sp. GBBC 3334]